MSTMRMGMEKVKRDEDENAEWEEEDENKESMRLEMRNNLWALWTWSIIPVLFLMPLNTTKWRSTNAEVSHFLQKLNFEFYW